jgi:hypothetical protein
MTLTIDQHVSAIRHLKRGGMNDLVAAIRSDPLFAKEVDRRMKLYADMEKSGRLAGCWISRTTKQTLTVALTAAKTQPGVPAGER